MTKRGYFTIRRFKEHLGDKQADLPGTGFQFVGNKSSVKQFEVEGSPTGGYLLMQVDDINDSNHNVLINGKNIPGSKDILGEPQRWETWMESIPSGFLKKGNNTLQIVRDTSVGDNFLVADVAIHWRESD